MVSFFMQKCEPQKILKIVSVSRKTSLHFVYLYSVLKKTSLHFVYLDSVKTKERASFFNGEQFFT